MLTNGFITRIDRQTGVSATGQIIRSTGTPIGVRCYVGSISRRQRYTLGASLEDADQVCIVTLPDLAAASQAAPQRGDHMVLVPDGDGQTAIAADVVTTTSNIAPGGGGNSNTEIFLRRLPLAPAIG